MQTSKAAVAALAGSLLLAPLMLGPSQAGSPPDLKIAVNASHDGIVALVGGGHGGGWGGHMGGGWRGPMGGGPRFSGHMGSGPRFGGHMGGGSPSSSGHSGGRGRVASHNGGNGIHLDDDFVHHGQFKIVHNPNVDSRRLNGDHELVDNGQFKMVHSSNFDNRRLNGDHLDNDLVDGFKFIPNPNFDHRFNRRDLDNDLFDDLFGRFSLFDRFDQFKFDNRRFNNSFIDSGFFGGFAWWSGDQGNTCWIWWPDDGWVWQCS